METVFERIIKREIPAHIVYEDDLVIAFLDISQATKGHTLVCTKVAYKDIFELPIDVAQHLFGVVATLSKAIKKAFNPEGLNTLNNNGVIASQSVFHFHVHIIPRYLDDRLTSMVLPNNFPDLSRFDFESRRDAIVAALL